MRVRRFPPAVYQCALPIRKRSHEAAASPPAKGRRKPPYPAWPEIRNRWRWVSLPALNGAAYFLDKPGATTYVSVAERWIQSISDLMSHAPTSASEHTASPLANAPHIFYGPEDFFAFCHEVLHALSARFTPLLHAHSPVKTWADAAHGTLITISTETTSVSTRALTYLWNDFFRANDELVRAIHTYRPVEEVAATRFAMDIAPPDCTAEVKIKVEKTLRDEGLYDLYLQSHTPEFRGVNAIFLPVLAPWVVDHLKIDAAEAFHSVRALSSLLQGFEWRDNPVAFSKKMDMLFTSNKWKISISNLVTRMKMTTVDVDDVTPSMLWGRGTEVDYDPNVDSPELAKVADELAFWESMRQQVSQIHGLYCPYRRHGQECCGRSKLLHTLWERLPEEYQTRMTPPDCPKG